MPNQSQLVFRFVILLSLILTVTPAPVHGAALQDAPPQPQVRAANRRDTSLPLRAIPPIPPEPRIGEREIPTLPLPQPEVQDDRLGALSFQDPVLQEHILAPAVMPSPIVNFEGISNINGVHPPDTQGDIGPNHYVQWVNLAFGIWDKAGNLLYGPANGDTLWTGFGGPCENVNDGDPITLYDQLADRWLMSQFALPNYPSGPFYQCIAVSTTPDPTGSWHRYEYQVPVNKMNDYPKFGVWPDGYYMTVNQFTGGSLSWAGAAVFAFERSEMLLGHNAQMIYIDLYSTNSNWGGMLPSDLDGDTPPPTDAPNYFVEVDNGSPDAMRIWEFAVDWTTPANSTFGLANQPNHILPVASFTMLCPYTRNCIPQPGTSQKLDGIGDRLMYRLAYRNFGTHESLVVNHSVNVGANRAGVRWYEVRDPGGSPTIYQQGTYAPADGLHRWMGSIAMDQMGNVALGYSVSSNSVYPSIRYTGRLASDPLGEMSQGEAQIIAGSGSQTSSYARWGDYSMMGIDPADDCTFWYTQEYIETTGYANWQTRVASFRFPNCGSAVDGTLTGILHDAGGTPADDPIAGAQVQASASPTQTWETTSGMDGGYTLSLPGGIYTVTGSAYGYETSTITGVVVSAGATQTLDIPLTPAPTYVVSGAVTDAATGWPLYARIQIDGYLGSTVWSDPVTGFYSVTLPGEAPYTFDVQAWVDGYLPAARDVEFLSGDRTEHFGLTADPSACDAPGYVSTGGCQPTPGGLVVGNVYDEYTGAPLPGSSLVNAAGYTATAAATVDPAVDDAFYTLFAPPGPQVTTATMAHYGPATATIAIVQGDTVAQDWLLPAGRLSYAPDSLSLTLPWGGNGSLPLTLTNAGGVTVSFDLIELAAEELVSGTVESPYAIIKPFKQNFSTTLKFKLPDPPSAPLLPGGDVLQSWTVDGNIGNIGSVWGVAPVEGGVWVASPSPGWSGENRIFEYTPDGAPTGRSHPFAWQPPFGPADAAVNWHTGMIWVMNIDSPGGNNCIYELDPASGYTGDHVCPEGGGFANSQRGLAYDPSSDTWYAGGWNDQMIYHFDAAGRVLRAVNVPLGVAGLAYNPDTHHLFLLTNDDPSRVYVLDAADYATLGYFDIGAGLGDYAGAGLEFDCAGRLWAVDLTTDTVYQFESGESTTLCQYDVDWLSTYPTSGRVGAGSGQVVSVTFDAGGIHIPDWGTYHARLKIEHDAPYTLTTIPVTMTVEPPPPALSISKVGAEEQVGLGAALRYALTVTNAAGPATGVTISDTQPANTQFLSASHGGGLVGNDVVWSDLEVPGMGALSVFYTVTIGCVPSGTAILNTSYQVTAAEWPTPTLGAPVTVTAVSKPVVAAFDFDTPVVRAHPVRFVNGSQNCALYRWDLGDGVTSTLANPTHAYADLGARTVVLTASNLCGASAVYSRSLMVEEYAAEIAPDAVTVQADPGAPVTYTLRLTNTGTLADRFALELGGQQWETALSTDTVGPLEPGEGDEFAVHATVPITALAGDWDRAVVTATPSSDPRTPPLTASSRLTTAARAVYSVTLSPDVAAGSATPGHVATYLLHAANNGNISDTYTVSLTGSGWPTTLSPAGSFALEPGTWRRIWVSVTIPLTATWLEQAVTGIEIVGAGGGATASQLTTSVECVPLGGASFVYQPTTPGIQDVVTFTGRVWEGTPPFTYTWDFGDGSPLLARGGEPSSGHVVTHAYGMGGAYRVVMTVTHCLGGYSDRAAHVVTLADEPYILAQPSALSIELRAGESATLPLTIENRGTIPLTWDLAPQPPVVWMEVEPTEGSVAPLSGTSVVVSFTVPLSPTAPMYTTTLRVASSDPDRPTLTLPVTLTIATDCEPVEGVDFVYAPTAPQVGQSVLFTGMAASGTARLPVTYTWNFGDGSALRVGNPATHVFTAARTYTVSLTVANVCPSQGAREKGVVVYGNVIYLPLVLK